MATLECTAVEAAGVWLVQARVSSSVDRRVRVEATHDASVWPPRRQGVPAAGWSDDGWTGVLQAGESVVLGYATPGPVGGRPLRIAREAPAAADAAESVDPRAVLRSLGDLRQPWDAVSPSRDRR